MIIYEKENKLNINFDNSTEAEPDVVISKEDGQVNIEAGGQPIGGGSAPLIVNNIDDPEHTIYTMDKTWKEINDAFCAGTTICVVYENDRFSIYSNGLVIGSNINSGQYEVVFCNGQNVEFYSCRGEDEYPSGNYYGD